MDPFARGHYVDYRFKGSTSIKAVLPVIAPKLSYKDLKIGNGGLALAKWHKMIFDQSLTKEEKTQIAESLLEYCKLDTFAMVEIYRYLTELVK